MTLEQVILELEQEQEQETSIIVPPSAAALQASLVTLTTREKDVLRLLATGLTSAQISEKLFITVLTVNTHIRSIYSKIGVNSRSAATRYAIDHQLA
jgi:DNA-binding NarL/FixJ family response regulator